MATAFPSACCNWPAAYMAFANDGEVMPLTFLKREAEEMAASGSSRRTLPGTVRAMMETVTEEGGTAALARVPGYRVAGKTGTAHKLIDGHYSPDRYIASFVGMAPASDPRLIIAVMIDEPSDGEYYGGSVAGPGVRAGDGRRLRMLGLPPDAPETETKMTENAASAKGGA